MKAIMYILRCLWAFIIFMVAVLVLNNASPIYNFAPSKPFSGDVIYNPYADFDSTSGWSRANFHCHTKVDGILNECEYSPEETIAFYKDYGYSIATISNHMEITTPPDIPGISNPVRIYEHGYNLLNHHHLVFNPKRVIYYDIVTPFLASQKQFLTDLLQGSGDFIFLNHIQRLRCFNPSQMEKISGYAAVEADAYFDDNGTDLALWDAALSAGHYSTNAISDDLHHPDNSNLLARRCTFFNLSEPSYEELKKAMLAGNFYSMKVPDFGSGDTVTKIDGNRDLPFIENITLDGTTLTFDLSETPLMVEAVGQDGELRKAAHKGGNIYEYTFRPEDTYVRFHFDFGPAFEIYTNPFVRTDDGKRPPVSTSHTINIPLTVIFNLVIAVIAAFLFTCSRRLIPIPLHKRQ